MIFLGAAGLAASFAALFLGAAWIRPFFYLPVWASTLLVLSGLNKRVSGRSLLQDDPASFLRMAAVSTPFWLFFEKWKKKSRNARNMKYEVCETDVLAAKTTCTETTISTSTALTVAEKGIFVQGCTVFNANKKEYARVVAAVTSTGAGTITLTLMSGVAINHATGTATGVWDTGDTIINLGVTSTEGATDPQAVTRLWDNRYNYCEIVDTQITMSDIAEMSLQFGTSDRRKFEAKNALLEHMGKLEAKMFFGTRDTGTDTKTWWTTGGLLDANVGISSSNVIDAAGADFTLATFENFLESIYENGGSTRKMAFCSPGGLKKINDLYKDSYTVQVSPGDKMVGTSTRTIFHALGELELIPHYLFNPTRYGSVYGNMIFVVDPEFVGKVGFAGQGGIMHRKDRQANNVNYTSDNIRTIFGVDLMRPEVHGLIHNFA